MKPRGLICSIRTNIGANTYDREKLYNNKLNLAPFQDHLQFLQELFSLAFYLKHGWIYIKVTDLLAPIYQDHLSLVQ